MNLTATGDATYRTSPMQTGIYVHSHRESHVDRHLSSPEMLSFLSQECDTSCTLCRLTSLYTLTGNSMQTGISVHSHREFHVDWHLCTLSQGITCRLASLYILTGNSMQTDISIHSHREFHVDWHFHTLSQGIPYVMEEIWLPGREMGGPATWCQFGGLVRPSMDNAHVHYGIACFRG